MTEEIFQHSVDHVLSELERIDLLIQFQVLRARRLYNQDERFRGLYISEQDVDDLLQNPTGLPIWAAEPLPSAQYENLVALETIAGNIERMKAASARHGIDMRLERLTTLFGLEPFEKDILLVALSAEFDLRYEHLFAYLQDDVTKKRPSVDLVLNLLCRTMRSKIDARRYFYPDATLIKHMLIEVFKDPSQPNPPLLGHYLKAEERVVAFLMNDDSPDKQLQGHVRFICDQDNQSAILVRPMIKNRLARMISKGAIAGGKFLFYLQGPYGAGKRATVQAVCHDLGICLLQVEGDSLAKSNDLTIKDAMQLIRREVLLQNAAVYWTDFEAVLAQKSDPKHQALVKELFQIQGIHFVAGTSEWQLSEIPHDVAFCCVEFSLPDFSRRFKLWAQLLKDRRSPLPDADLRAIASQFRLSSGQIIDVLAMARHLASWRNSADSEPAIDDLYEACRRRSNRLLSSLAKKTIPHFTWEDIVLPADRLEQLQEICNTVKYRALVYDEWGFNNKLSLGKGLNVLFSGPSGTGKTMAAEIMAGHLGVDLFKIDLSAVVSKYIGETEKNLARIFKEAETSNTILFFDEADALFGKRSEVRDAHDRYANIEISFMLQKMEEFEGIVILATNLRKNMDDAFVRRMHYSIDFPFPGLDERRRIWEQIWPDRLPRSPDLDLDAMARNFEVSGGNIRNIALTAAFLAADDGRFVNMNHLVQATRREYQKMGKVNTVSGFVTQCAARPS